MCSYHGWRFKGDGACTKVPQALDDKANTAACSNSRSCAVSHPTQVALLVTLLKPSSWRCSSLAIVQGRGLELYPCRCM